MICTLKKHEQVAAVTTAVPYGCVHSCACHMYLILPARCRNLATESYPLDFDTQLRPLP